MQLLSVPLCTRSLGFSRSLKVGVMVCFSCWARRSAAILFKINSRSWEHTHLHEACQKEGLSLNQHKQSGTQLTKIFSYLKREVESRRNKTRNNQPAVRYSLSWPSSYDIHFTRGVATLVFLSLHVTETSTQFSILDELGTGLIILIMSGRGVTKNSALYVRTNGLSFSTCKCPHERPSTHKHDTFLMNELLLLWPLQNWFSQHTQKKKGFVNL